jgi:hypothetical protein
VRLRTGTGQAKAEEKKVEWQVGLCASPDIEAVEMDVIRHVAMEHGGQCNVLMYGCMYRCTGAPLEPSLPSSSL